MSNVHNPSSSRRGAPAGERRLGEFLSAVGAGVERPIGSAVGLPPEAYTSETIYDLEQTQVFGGGWIAAAFEHQIPDAGDAIPVELAGVPLIILRHEDGGVRAFVNICRHRGARVLTKPVRRRKAFTCIYHAWTYGQDGQLKRTPFINGQRDATPPCNLGLVPVRCAAWLDLIFVDLSGKAPSLQRHIEPLKPLWDIYDTSRLTPIHHEGGIVAGNWKLAIEAAVDTYHEGFVHRSLSHRLDGDGRRTFDDVGTDALFGIAWQGDSSLRAPVPLAPLAPGVAEGDRRDSLCFLFPNAQFNMFGGLSVRTIWTALAPDRTEWRSTWYLVDDCAADDSFAQVRDEIIRSWREIREEDRRVIELMQAGRRTRMTPPVIFVPFWEQTALRFQQLWAKAIQSAEA